MADWDNQGGLMDEVLTIRMHTKVTSGGRNLSFAALVAVGDGNGKVGLGYGKAPGVPMAIEKANKEARESMLDVPLVGDTVCHQHTGRHKSSEVFIKPAAPGTGVKAGATVRSIMQVLGVHNVLTKSLGRNNPLNLAKATMTALKEMRSVEEVEELRGVPVFLKHPQIDALKEQMGVTEGGEAETADSEAEEEPESVEEPEAEEPEDLADETDEADPGEEKEPVEAAESEDEDETE
ncbi:MAG: 30S ribosomal protein S5 [Planctomycetota bacterium]